MLVYGLRLLVALITFGVGVAASWLVSADRPTTFETRVLVDSVSEAHVFVADAPRGACDSKRRPRVVMGDVLSPRVVMGGVLNEKAVSKPEPAYPSAAKAAGVTGRVVVHVEVGEGGDVVTAEAIDGPSLLRDAAEEAARQAHFPPTRLSGEPVRVSGVVTYDFRLR
jgi:TonB family protein